MNLGLHLLAAAERHPEAEALVDETQRLTYAALLGRAQAVAGGLAGLGVGPGTRVAAALRNRIDTVVLYWATQWLGAVFVPVNWRLKPAEVAYCVDDSEAAVFACEPASAEAARGLRAGPAVVLLDAGTGPTPDGPAPDGAVSFAELAAAAAPGPPAVPDGAPSLMLYTSGTTGRPKGVPRSQAAERAAGLAHALQCRYGPGERTLGVMPLYHTMAMRSLLAVSAVGGCFVVRSEFRAAEALATIEAERITALYLAPTLYHDLVAALGAAGRGRLRVPNLAYAGAPMSATLVEACMAAFAPESFVNHYGSTEIYTFSIHPDQVAKPGCAGRPGVNARLRLVATDPGAGPGDEVAPGEVGEVICHLGSDEAFAGYWRRPDADERAIRHGWYFTGDLGRLDGDGDLWLVGRADDMVISGGENIHPTEVEDLLAAHPGVREAAVIGVPDARFGQRVVAYVVAAADGVTGEDLDRHCLESSGLASFKRPREYRFVTELPKSSSGKLLRRLLRDPAEPTPMPPPSQRPDR